MPDPDPARPFNPLFVTGVWRSGTSLLASLLNQHPHIALMYESGALDFPSWLEKLRLAGDWLRRQEFLNRALSRHGLIYGGSLRGLEQVATPEDLYRVYAAGKGATHWGEKYPGYARLLPRIARDYPHSAIIVIWRDPEEIMRSIRKAGEVAPYFHRRGMLGRVLGYHEKMLRDTTTLAQAGHQILQLDYDQLVDQPVETMRQVCAFIGVDYAPRMTSLQGADFTTVFESPIHDHLRGGVIVRQPSHPPLSPTLTAKLARFRNRTLRLRGLAPRGAEEPSAVELLRLRIAGGCWDAVDGTMRVLFEFLPLAWLESYRALKVLFLAGNTATVPASAGMRAGRLSVIFVSYGILALNAWVKFLKPNLMFMPLALLSCMGLALAIDRRSGIVAAGIAALTIPLVEGLADPDHASLVVLVWNALMRFIVLAVFVFLLDAARSNVARPQPT